ncbi:hypothetical protein DVH24_033298 [Malus domestica]|uniref:Complex III subunit VI n=1 Tax=Malus domestica TaxID=3750 RepID=A0A498JF81_MALDO|nr:hypothetical protein DVH24_033298 [Malus domestica]
MDWAYVVGLDLFSPGNKTQRRVICQSNRKGKERVVAESSFGSPTNSKLPQRRLVVDSVSRVRSFGGSPVRVVLADIHLSQTLRKAGALCTGYDLLEVALGAMARKKKADEEPVDQKKYLEESCKPKCVKPFLEYQACVKRIQDDDSGHKHCTGQYFDFWSCIDKCLNASKRYVLFPELGMDV